MPRLSDASKAGTRQILGFVYFTFICYLSIGLPLAILPAYVHLRMGYQRGAGGAGDQHPVHCHVSSRPWAGRISDHAGAKVSVLWGMGACTASGVLLLVRGGACTAIPRGSAWFALIASRLVLGVGESLGSTGSTLWGITAAGPEHTAKVISFNGISHLWRAGAGRAAGRGDGAAWGLASLGLLTVLMCGVSFCAGQRARDRFRWCTASICRFAMCWGG